MYCYVHVHVHESLGGLSPRTNLRAYKPRAKPCTCTCTCTCVTLCWMDEWSNDCTCTCTCRSRYGSGYGRSGWLLLVTSATKIQCVDKHTMYMTHNTHTATCTPSTCIRDSLPGQQRQCNYKICYKTLLPQ